MVILCCSEALSATFKVINCVYHKSPSPHIELLMDDQFLTDVKEKLSEGADYLFYVELEKSKGRESISYRLSYNPVTHLFIIKNTSEERFRNRSFFLQHLKRLRIPVKRPPIRVRVKRVDPYMPFPLNLIPGLGTYRTDWVRCHGRDRQMEP